MTLDSAPTVVLSDLEEEDQTYEVQLEAFTGPMDLLLHLIRKQKVNIYDIPIALIARQYLEYLSIMKTLNLSMAGEFLVMASTLMQIKVSSLLPKVEGAGGEYIFEEVTGPLGEKLRARYGFLGNGQTAVIEMAAASGLELVPVGDRNHLNLNRR